MTKTMNGMSWPARCLAALLLLVGTSCRADEQLVTTASMADGQAVPYILNTAAQASPRYVLILFPGGAGIVDPHRENGKLVYSARNNFLLRARPYFVDDEFATVSTNATSSEERVQALLDDLQRRFPDVRIYLVGTSRGTIDTMTLAGYLSERIAGEVHTSSMQRIAYFDAHKYRNRQLIVHHRDDSCRNTPLTAAQWAHKHYGDELILMEGGISVGDACEAFSHHGYNGIEKETAEAIKQWVKQGG